MSDERAWQVPENHSLKVSGRVYFSCCLGGDCVDVVNVLLKGAVRQFCGPLAQPRDWKR